MTTNNLPQLDAKEFITTQNSELRTTTLKVAEAFNKLHKDILRKIESIDCSKEFTERNFTLSEYTDSTGRKLPYYEMTKDGFMFLVMGFTGKKAAQVKEAYINAFNWMATQLQPVIESNCLTPDQKGHIYQTVMQICHQTGKHYQTVFGDIKRQFRVASYKEIPATQYNQVCEYLSIEPLEGELLPKPCKHMTLDLPAESAKPTALRDSTQITVAAFSGDAYSMETGSPMDQLFKLLHEAKASDAKVKIQDFDGLFNYWKAARRHIIGMSDTLYRMQNMAQSTRNSGFDWR